MCMHREKQNIGPVSSQFGGGISVTCTQAHGVQEGLEGCGARSPMSAVTRVDWFSGSEMDACSWSGSSLASCWLWLSSERSSENSSSSLQEGSEVKGLQVIQEICT